MPAYVVADIEVQDADAYEEYKSLAAASVSQYGGRYIVRGGRRETLEGDWEPSRIAILEFPTLERAREWWTSQEYGAAKGIRHGSARSRLILIEGTS